MKNKKRLKLISFLFIIISTGFLLGRYLVLNFYYKSQASVAVSTFNFNRLAAHSFVKSDQKTSIFSFYKTEGYLYKDSQATTSQVSVMNFIKQTPDLEQKNLQEIRTFISPNNINLQTKEIFPNNFNQNSVVIRSFSDKKDNYLTKQGINLGKEHYFYNQKISGIPVYKAILAVHMQNSNEIYALSGNLTLDENVLSKTISLEKAKEIAIEEAKRKTNQDLDFKIDQTAEYIFNKKILGLSEDATNYPVLAVDIISSAAKPPSFFMRFLVDLSSGKIVFEENLIKSSLNRNVYNCAGATSNCGSPVRSDGVNPYVLSGIAEVDNAFTYLGKIYNFFKDSFGEIVMIIKEQCWNWE
jgi:Zn-dependent metalloprotease